MNRFERIGRHAEKEEQKALDAEMKKEIAITNFKSEIRKNKERIENLIKLGEHCRKNGIKIICGATEKDDFVADGFYHKFGFYCSLYNFEIHEITKVGIDWYDGETVFTDGTNIEIGHNTFNYGYEEKIKSWLDGLDSFEKRFFEFIDNLDI